MISVITPVRKANQTYLETAYQSILIQDIPFEWNIEVDGDESLAEEVKSLLPSDSRIKVEASGKQAGPIVARNYALYRSNYEIVRNLDSDDYFLPNAFNEIISAMEDVALCLSPILLEVDGDVIQPNYTADFIESGVYLPGQLDKTWRTGKNFGFACNVLSMKRKVALSYGGYYNSVGIGDLLLILMMAEHHKSAVLNNVGSVYRIHPGQSVAKENPQFTLRNRKLMSEILKSDRKLRGIDTEHPEPVLQPTYLETILPK